MLGSRFVGRSAPRLGVGDQADPERVDVKLHCPHRSGTDENLRQRTYGLAVSGGVDQVAVGVDADARAPHTDRVADGHPPGRPVGEIRIRLAALNDQGQVLARKVHSRRHLAAPRPRQDVDPPIGVADERGHPRSHRRIGGPADREATPRILELEAAVEGREQAPTHRRWNLHLASGQRYRWLHATRIQGDPSLRGVDPGDTGDHPRIAGITAELGYLHRMARARPALTGNPHALPRQRRLDQRRNVGRMDGGVRGGTHSTPAG